MFRYFVVLYVTWEDNAATVANTYVETSYPISTIDHIREIERKALKDLNGGGDLIRTVVLMDWKVLPYTGPRLI